MNAILKALPALLAIKGIMVLAKAGSALKNLTDFFRQKFPTGGFGGGGGGGGGGGTDIVPTGTGSNKNGTPKGDTKPKGGGGKGFGIAAIIAALLTIPSSTQQPLGHEGEKIPTKPKDKKGYTTYWDSPSFSWKFKKIPTTSLVVPTPKASAAGGYYSGSTFIPSKTSTTTPSTVNNGSIFNIEVKADNKTNGTKVGVDIVNAIKDYERKNGTGWRK
jgi:hypothetical protein